MARKRMNSSLIVLLSAIGLGWTNFPTASAQTFRGYECTVDCSGHEAGYEWAEEKGIDDPDDCGGNSDSFIEGCRAYAEEQGSDSDDNGGEDDDRERSDDDDDD